MAKKKIADEKAEATEIVEPKKEPMYKKYTVTISATEEQINYLKSAMAALGITYKGFVELTF